MRRSLGLSIVVLGLVWLLAACGGGIADVAEDAADAGAADAGAAPSEGTAESANAAAAGSADGETASTGENAEAAKTLKVTHELGVTTVPIEPNTVVVFDFGTLDTLDQLGVEVKGVPQANLPAYLEKYKDAKYENVGSLMEPDFEKIAALEPDLIVISGRQREAYAELSKLGPTVYLGVDADRYMESYRENATTIGKLFRKEAEVEAELAKVEAQVAALRETASASGNTALVVLANEGNISAYGPGSRFGIVHDVFGLKAADEQIEVSTHGMSVTFEYILEKNPDYLFVVDRGAAVADGQPTSQALIENELVMQTDAYKSGHIVYLNPDYWYLSGGGLVSVAEMAKEIAEGIE